MSFNILNIASRYRTGTSNEPLKFYAQCLRSASRYDRLAGYFRSSSLSTAAAGMSKFLYNNGKIRLICSPDLTKEDIKAMASAGSSCNEIIEKRLLASIKDFQTEIEKRCLNVLAWLIHEGKIQIKIAVRDKGIYHEKLGIFYDNDENILSFGGSSNETRGGLVDNFERITVFRSWYKDGKEDHIGAHVDDFDTLWKNTSNGISVYDLPKAAQRGILSFKKTSKPSEYDPEIEEYIKLLKKPSFPADYEKRDYQTKAVKKWSDNNFIGLFEMATGTGKTITALRSACEYYKSQESVFTLILVPSKSLVNQWKKDLELFNFERVILASSDFSDWSNQFAKTVNSFHMGNIDFPVVISTYKSFATSRYQNLLEKIAENCLLIADEVHTMGSAQNLKLIPKKIPARIGLSATPKRHFDEEGTSALIDFFKAADGPVYQITIKEAQELGFLCSYNLHLYTVELTEDEYDNYKELSKKIGQLTNIRENGKYELYNINDQLERLMLKRKRILNSAKAKENATRDILNKIKKEFNLKYTLLYCPEGEDEDSAEKHITNYLKLTNDFNLKVSKFIGETDSARRKMLLKRFADGDIDCLVAMKCLDEGIDIKRTEHAIFISSSTNPRQYIQRRGRVLRPHQDKKRAQIYDIIVKPPLSAPIDKTSKSVLFGELERFKEFAQDAENDRDMKKEIEILEKFYKLRNDKELDIDGAK